MPPAGRLSTSGSLETHDVWQKSVGHDPYRGADEGGSGTAIPEVGEINSSAKGLFRLAQLTGNSSTLAPGACKRCGQVGHLYFNCRNFLNKSQREQELEQQVEEEDDDDVSNEFPTSDEDDSSDDSDDAGDSSDDSDSDSDSSSSGKKKKKGKKRKKPSKKEKSKAKGKSKKKKKEKKDKKGKAKKKKKKT